SATCPSAGYVESGNGDLVNGSSHATVRTISPDRPPSPRRMKAAAAPSTACRNSGTQSSITLAGVLARETAATNWWSFSAYAGASRQCNFGPIDRDWTFNCLELVASGRNWVAIDHVLLQCAYPLKTDPTCGHQCG